jgi:hypothetical protein
MTSFFYPYAWFWHQVKNSFSSTIKQNRYVYGPSFDNSNEIRHLVLFLVTENQIGSQECSEVPAIRHIQVIIAYNIFSTFQNFKPNEITFSYAVFYTDLEQVTLVPKQSQTSEKRV